MGNYLEAKAAQLNSWLTSNHNSPEIVSPGIELYRLENPWTLGLASDEGPVLYHDEAMSWPVPAWVSALLSTLGTLYRSHTTSSNHNHSLEAPPLNAIKV